MFKLLAVYSQMKNDIQSDIGTANTSLSWRHRIATDGEEVQNANLFFRRCIRQIVNGTWNSYSVSTAYNVSHVTATAHLCTVNTPIVYMARDAYRSYIGHTLQVIQQDLHTYFLYPYADLWPEAEPVVNHEEGDITLSSDNLNEYNEEGGDDIMLDVSLDSEVPLPSLPDNPSASPNRNDLYDDASALLSPYDTRTWDAWGNVHMENVVYGRRPRNSPALYLPSRRRLFRQ